jgi:DNA polymerase/3'-5' exonuclease PolX
MNYAAAQQIADELIRDLQLPDRCCEEIVVAGSLRRQRSNVGDLDLVARHSDPAQRLLLRNRLWRAYQGRPEKFGDKYICLENYKGIQVDVYLAEPETFATLLLIRTGSKEHNILLATRAQELDLHLNANGDGLTDRKTGERIPIQTEQDLFAALKLPYKEPWEREA